MSKVAVITDGVNDLSKEQIEEYDILTIPYRILFDDEIHRIWYNDRCTITLEKLCERIAKSSKDDLPKTSLPTPKEFHAVFDDALGKASSMIGVFQAAEMSGAYQLAVNIANNGYKERDISIFDSKRIMTGSGIQALEAAKLAKKGKSKAEILAHLETIKPYVRTIVFMNDLKFLYYGGRIGRAKKLMGSAMGVIPILHFQDGIPSPVGTIKGTKNLSQQLTKFCKKIMNEAVTDDIFLTHINQEEVTKNVYESMVDANYANYNIHYKTAGPIMSIYSGTKAICLTYIGNWNKDWLLKS